MKILDPGHRYEVAIYDGGESFARVIQFMKRVGDGYPGNAGPPYEGTNIQEVLRVLIDRVQYLDGQISDKSNLMVIDDLRHALRALELRAARRHGRTPPEFRFDIENEPVCPKCGHIGCKEAT